jgi:hypothetical protein
VGGKQAPAAVAAADAVTDADQLVALGRIKVEPRYIPELEATIYIRQMPGASFWRFAKQGKVDGVEAEYSTLQTCTGIALSLCDQAGKMVFDDADKGALLLQDNWKFKQITAVFAVIADFNGLSERKVEETAGN